MSTRKLYTEEQVIELTNALKSIKLMFTAHSDYQHDIEFEDRVIQIDEALEKLIPIELPNDEEIEKFAFEKYHEIEDSRWFEPLQVGAKWMCDKIQGGNK